MLQEEEFYPVYLITGDNVSEGLCRYHCVDMTEEELKQYQATMTAYYEMQELLQVKWDIRHVELKTERRQ